MIGKRFAWSSSTSEALSQNSVNILESICLRVSAARAGIVVMIVHAF
jgi:hypothetical protein